MKTVTHMAAFAAAVTLTASTKLVAAAAVSDACAAWRSEAEARTAGIGLPYLTGDARFEPGPDDRGGREERGRVGIALDLHDWSRRSASSSRAAAECLAAARLESLANAPDAARAKADRDGLAARLKALETTATDLADDLARRRRRLAGFAETRPRVDLVASELAVVEQERITVAARLAEAERRLAQAGGDEVAKLADNDAVAAAAREAAGDAALARAVEARGPAWALTVGAGMERRRYRDDEGDVTQAKGRPVYASVDFKWLLGSAVAGALVTGGAATGTTSPVETAATRLGAWQQDQAAFVAEYSDQLARVKARRAELAGDLALAQRVSGDAMRDFVDRLVREDHRLAADEADWSARLVSLGGGVLVAAAPNATTKRDLKEMRALPKLEVTEGDTSPAETGAHRTVSSKLRAKVLDAKPDSITVDFKYLGPTKDLVPLESGEQRRQFGVYLAAGNQCNLLYAMWRLADEDTGAGELVVQTKKNPGMKTHDECGNSGYDRVTPTRTIPMPKLVPGVTYRVAARLKDGRLTVGVGGLDVWTGNVATAGLTLGKAGFSGVRSDNVRIELRALEAAP